MNMQNSEALIQTLFGSESRLAALIDAYEPRPVQNRMAQWVVDAVNAELCLVVEAPTGTGKTLAYLLPLLAMGRPVIVSTATKALQDQIFDKDVPLLRQVLQRTFTATSLKGRSNYLCLSRFNLFRRQGMIVPPQEYSWSTRLVHWADQTVNGDRDELDELPEQLSFWKEVSAGGDHCTGRRCQEYDACFLTKARDLAKKSDLVVVNHHLFFADLAVRDGGFGEILPNHGIVVFDEAHKIPDVVTQFFGRGISNHKLRELALDCRRELEEIGADDPMVILALPTLELAGSRLREAFPKENKREGLTPDHLDRNSVSGQAILQVESTLHHLLKVLEPHRVRTPGLAACGRRAEEMLEDSGWIRTMDDAKRVYWYETRDRGIFLTASPLETGPTLQELLYPRLKTVIFTSATLTTGGKSGGFAFFLDQLGLAEQTTMTQKLPPVFDYRNQAILYLPETMPQPDDPLFPQAVVEEIVALLEATSGRALCLFTSLRMLTFVREGLTNRVRFPLLVQGERSKGALLEAFRDQTSSVLLGMASFWEGVDVPGDALSMVIIDRLPFASPGDPIVAARCRWLETNHHNPFMEMFVPRAILSLKQGLGRLLRRSTDRGVIAILDVRLTQKRYGRQFIEELPPAMIVRTQEAVCQFFQNL